MEREVPRPSNDLVRILPRKLLLLLLFIRVVRVVVKDAKAALFVDVGGANAHSDWVDRDVHHWIARSARGLSAHETWERTDGIEDFDSRSEGIEWDNGEPSGANGGGLKEGGSDARPDGDCLDNAENKGARISESARQWRGGNY